MRLRNFSLVFSRCVRQRSTTIDFGVIEWWKRKRVVKHNKGHKTMTDNEIARELWKVLSNLRRSAIEYRDNPSDGNLDYLDLDIGLAYDVLQENNKTIFREEA